MKIDRSLLRASWHSWVSADEPRAGPYWLQLVWTALFSVVLALGFTVLGFAAWSKDLQGWLDLDRWVFWYSKNLIVCLTIGYIIHALFEIGLWAIGGPPGVRRMSMLKRGFFFGGIPMLGVVIGWPLGFWLAGANHFGFFRTPQGLQAIAISVTMSAIISLVLYQWFSAKARAIAFERAATESQLRLLQAQIEPHFLFNTLANVETLIDHEPAKAKAMLSAFTDYLRAGLGGLRRTEAPLADELALAEAYLRVQQSRMEDRLHFSIEADEATRRAPLPPLLLQPLVENAVHHGLEPQVAGGTVRVRARTEQGRLVIEVQDDGRGLGAPSRKGAGLALANIRQRLAQRFGNEASLDLAPASPGTRAVLTLPLDTGAAA
jgi:signal transduction histidine kinase